MTTRIKNNSIFSGNRDGGQAVNACTALFNNSLLRKNYTRLADNQALKITYRGKNVTLM
jgi:hypothetical protein